VQEQTVTQTPQPPRARLGIVIINYRTPELTIDCLASLAGELETVDGRVVVVDNCSGDGSADKIEAWLNASPIAGRAHLIRSKINSGFSGGNNIGMAALDAQFYLLLNSDTLVRSGALGGLLAAAERRPDAGAIAPRLEDEDGTAQQSCFRFISPLSELLESSSSRPLSRLLGRFEVALPVSDAPMECDWASFACILLRREAVDAAGPMDEGFFMYFEDAEYCRRFAKAGYATLYDPSARVVHLRGGSSPVKAAMARGNRPPAYYYASRTRYFRNSYGPAGPVAANLLWLFGRVIARARPLTGKPLRRACKNQARDIWTNWRDPLGDNKAPSAAPETTKAVRS
jgi:GT2 family glycosyltransferase